MSSEGNKTEQPTPKRIKDARKEGNVGFSKDLSMFGSITTMVILLYSFRHILGDKLHLHWEAVFLLIATPDLDFIELVKLTVEFLKNLVLIIGPFVLAAAFITLVVTVMQHGGMLITNKLFKFDLKKFDVVSNLKQIFSKKNFSKFALNCLKVSIMVYIGYLIFSRNLNDILLLREIAIDQAIAFIIKVILNIVIVLLVLFFLFGVVDLILEKRSVLEQLMMTLEEVKREYKESEGDPEVKHQRKELHRELLEEEPSHAANSSFVIANPTHIAIVVIYKPLKWKIPIILAKEKGEAAQQVFAYAKKRKIPIIREPWLARQLYSIAKLKDFVPRSLIEPMADLIVRNINLLPQVALELEELNKQKESGVQHAAPKAPAISKGPLYTETLRN